jgi:hypothetical protein
MTEPTDSISIVDLTLTTSDGTTLGARVHEPADGRTHAARERDRAPRATTTASRAGSRRAATACSPTITAASAARAAVRLGARRMR